MASISKMREEGVGASHQANDWKGTPPRTAGDVSDSVRKLFSRFQGHFLENQRAYANVRRSKGLSPEPRYILSDFGLTSSVFGQQFSWVYLPPVAGAYHVWPEGVLRPWSFICLHCFGGSFDQGIRPGVDRETGKRISGKGLIHYKDRLTVSGDQYGHNPKRWFSGIKELTKNPELTAQRGSKARRVSIHVCISRRGDVVVSTDLNDQAWHCGGDILNPKGNNFVTVGIELETQFFRFVPRGPLFISPYPDPQMKALAIVCKKITTFRPIPQQYITKRDATNVKDFKQTRELAQKFQGGYVQHSDVNPVYTTSEGKRKGGKVDAGGQFNIIPGLRARVGSDVWDGTGIDNSNGDGDWMDSGWDQLWGLMAKPAFRLADQIFADKLDQQEYQQLAQVAEAIQKANSGQKAALVALHDQAASVLRANRMQSRSRRTTYNKAMSHSTAVNTLINTSSNALAKSLTSFDLSSIEPVGGPISTYDETTGLWTVRES